jgi:hypothetical protein
LIRIAKKGWISDKTDTQPFPLFIEKYVALRFTPGKKFFKLVGFFCKLCYYVRPRCNSSWEAVGSYKGFVLAILFAV